MGGGIKFKNRTKTINSSKSISVACATPLVGTNFLGYKKEKVKVMLGFQKSK